MKLSLMTRKQKHVELEKLAGRLQPTVKWEDVDDAWGFQDWDSYDAIILLVQKLKIHREIEHELADSNVWCFNATPSQLCDDVLVVTGKAEL